ncbi:hypothetical protein VNO77_16045 [Canavalia gladiata]|uniref:Uncharacterized protein n=1 Tax=Canavalia gladiata TaxID=3824 RepID=A0AAN9QSS3_CANGL
MSYFAGFFLFVIFILAVGVYLYSYVIAIIISLYFSCLLVRLIISCFWGKKGFAIASFPNETLGAASNPKMSTRLENL